MKRILFFALIFIFVAWSAWGFADVNATVPTTDDSTTDNSTGNSTADNSTDSSVTYRIELGNGDGALLIIGDSNQVYLPPAAEEVEDQVQPNEITYSQDRDAFIMVLTETDIYIDGVRTRYSKLVIELTADGWELLWFEQGD